MNWYNYDCSIYFSFFIFYYMLFFITYKETLIILIYNVMFFYFNYIKFKSNIKYCNIFL